MSTMLSWKLREFHMQFRTGKMLEFLLADLERKKTEKLCYARRKSGEESFSVLSKIMHLSRTLDRSLIASSN